MGRTFLGTEKPRSTNGQGLDLGPRGTILPPSWVGVYAPMERTVKQSGARSIKGESWWEEGAVGMKSEEDRSSCQRPRVRESAGHLPSAKIVMVRTYLQKKERKS